MQQLENKRKKKGKEIEKQKKRKKLRSLLGCEENSKEDGLDQEAMPMLFIERIPIIAVSSGEGDKGEASGESESEGKPVSLF